METRRGGAIILPIILIAIGLFFLAVNLGSFGSWNIAALWPGILVLIGAGLFVQYFADPKHDPGLITGGTIFVLIGLFFFLFTFQAFVPGYGQVTWASMAQLWPAFPTIIGLALLLQWLFSRVRDTGVLIAAIILLTAGVVAFSLTLSGVSLFGALADYWPLLLIAIGIIVLIRAFRPASVKQKQS